MRISEHWKLGGLAIAAAFVAAPLPTSVNLASVALLLLAVGVGILRNPRLVSNVPALACMLIALWWLALLANPNVPSVEAGLLGYRLSVVFYFGVLLGIAWGIRSRPPLFIVWLSLVAICAGSVIVFLFFPGIEQSISRTAGEYTGLFQGQARLQGLFAGPFHAAMASAFLILTSLRIKHIVPSRFWRVFGFAVGIYCLYLSQVRTGIVAVVVGALVLLFTSDAVGTRIRRLGMLSTAALLAFVLIPQSSSLVSAVPALASLANASSDSRFLGRVTTWQESFNVIGGSPFFGWGPGSAGSALDAYFSSSVHVTTHNEILKFGVEGGLIGIVLVVIFWLSATKAVIATRDSTRMGTAVLVVALVFGATGTVTEVLPVSVGFAVILGYIINLSLQTRRPFGS
jgi:O-antigen ligase